MCNFLKNMSQHVKIIYEVRKVSIIFQSRWMLTQLTLFSSKDNIVNPILYECKVEMRFNLNKLFNTYGPSKRSIDFMFEYFF